MKIPTPPGTHHIPRSCMRDKIRDAIIGLMLLIGIYIILFQINPCILNLNVLQDFQSGASPTCPTS